LALIRTICDYLGGDRFSWRDILAAFDEHPEWVDINRHVTQKQS
jgi:spore coat polysaccharide biosynthesis protein SpsF